MTDSGKMRRHFLVLLLGYNQVINIWSGDMIQIKHLLTFLMQMRKIVCISIDHLYPITEIT